MDTSKKGSSKETETEEADTHKEETEVIQEEVPREKKEQMTEIWIVSSETIGWPKREATKAKRVNSEVI